MLKYDLTLYDFQESARYVPALRRIHNVSRKKIKIMLYNFDERLQTHFFCGVSCNNDLQTYIIRVNKVYFKFMLTINDLS